MTGVTGNVDLDLFAGTLTELRRLDRAARAGPAAPDVAEK